MEKGTIGVNKVCQLFGISKKTYYQSRDPKDRILEKYAWLLKHVQTVIRQNPGYGVIRIMHELRRSNGIVIGKRTLGKLLKMWGLQLNRKQKKSTFSGIHKLLCFLSNRANVLRRMQITAVLQAVSSDITELRYGGGSKKAYLCVHKDVYGMEVYGYDVRETMEAELVLTSLKKAQATIRKLVREWDNRSLLYHQDRGSQYTSYAYVQAVLRNGDRLSYSDIATPTDNPGQESFFGRLKDEWKDEIYELRDIKELQVYVRDKMRYYNEVRLHSSIGYMPPLEFTRAFLKSARNWFTKLTP